MWLVPNEPAAPDGALPTAREREDFVESWRDRGIDMRAVSLRATTDAQFARLLLEQAPTLEQIAVWLEADSTTRAQVTFFLWTEYFERLRAAAASTEGPHVLAVPSSWCAALSEDLGVLSSLPDRMAVGADSRFVPKLLDTCRVKGGLWGLPWRLDVRLLFFHKDRLPSLEDHFVGGVTREAFGAALRDAGAAQGDGAAFALPSARDWDLLHQTAMLVWGQGGELISPGLVGFESDLDRHGVAALAWLRSLAADGLVEFPPVTRAVLEQRFVDGELGSVVTGPWIVARLEARYGPSWTERIGVSTPPFGLRDEVTFLGGLHLSLGRAAAEDNLIDKAASLITHLTDGETLRKLGVAPAELSALGSMADLTPPADGEARTYLSRLDSIGGVDLAATFDRAIDVGRTYPVTSAWVDGLEVPATLSGLFHTWQAMAAGESEATIQDFVLGLDRLWDRELDPHRDWVRRLWILAGLLGALAAVSFPRAWGRRRRAGAAELYLADRRLYRNQLEEILCVGHGVYNGVNSILKQVQTQIERSAISVDVAAATLLDEPLGPDGPAPRIHVYLPGRREVKLRLDIDGKRIDYTAGHAKVLECMIREWFFEDRRDHSFLTGFRTLDWDDSAPVDPESTWSTRMAKMAKPFESRRMADPFPVPADSRGQGVTHFELPMSVVQCYVGDGVKLSDVVALYRAALDLQTRGAPHEALVPALEAYEMELALQSRDTVLLILIVRLHETVADADGFPEDLLLQARGELEEHARRIQQGLDHARAAIARRGIELSTLRDRQLRVLEAHLLDVQATLGEPGARLPQEWLDMLEPALHCVEVGQYDREKLFEYAETEAKKTDAKKDDEGETDYEDPVLALYDFLLGAFLKADLRSLIPMGTENFTLEEAERVRVLGPVHQAWVLLETLEGWNNLLLGSAHSLQSYLKEQLIEKLALTRPPAGADE